MASRHVLVGICMCVSAGGREHDSRQKGSESLSEMLLASDKASEQI